MSPTAARNVWAQITLTPGTVISRRTSSDSSACSAISASTAAISRSRNSTWRRQPATVSASSTGSSSSASHLRALTPNRSEKGGLPFRRRIKTAWISFLARERARTSCSRRASRRRNTLVCSIGRPDRVELAGPQQPGQRARIEPVGLRPRLADARVVRRHHDHPRHMRLQDPRDLPGAPGHLQSDPIIRAQALRKQLQLLRRSLDPARRAHSPRLDDRDLAELQVHVQPDRSPERLHLVLLRVVDIGGEARANDNDGYAL